MAVGGVGGVAVACVGGQASGVDREGAGRGGPGDVGHAGAAELGVVVGGGDRVDDADGGEARATSGGDVAAEGRGRSADARARRRGDRRSGRGRHSRGSTRSAAGANRVSRRHGEGVARAVGESGDNMAQARAAGVAIGAACGA